MLERYKDKARKLKTNIAALSIALKRHDVPWYAKAVIGVVVAYALSPIDLIPDFIPVLGLLDDIILLPFGIVLAVKLIPDNIWEECKRIASDDPGKMRSNKIVAGIIIAIWIVILFFIIRALYRIFSK